MITKFLPENEFYSAFFTEIRDVLCGDFYDAGNAQYVQWLQNYVKILYARGGEALCFYADEDEPVSFIYLLHDKGLDDVACFGKKAKIAMIEVVEKHRGKGYGRMLCQEAETHLRKRGAECVYIDTPDDPDDWETLSFCITNGYTPVGLHPCGNGRSEMSQVYLYKRP